MALFKTDKENLSYALGMNMGEYLQHLPLELDMNAFIKAFQDLNNGGKFEFSPDEYKKYMTMFQDEAKKAGEEALSQMATRNMEIEEKFMADNGAKAEVKTTSSGLQYIVLTDGKGAKPSKTSTVKVHYTGTLLNNQVFDSSVERGEPAVFGVNQVIPGWTEALQMMSVGSKYKLFIPAKLAYGEKGAGEVIPPYATLIFDVELLDIVNP